jgi:hypothetical protein
MMPRFVLAACAVALSVTPLSAQQPAAAADPYEHYTPGACVQAYQRVAQLQLRTGADTTKENYAAATLHPAAVDAARRCLAQLDVAATIPRDLVLLARVQLAAGDDAGAKRSIDRRLASEARASVETRANTLADVVQAYIWAEPHRVAEARAHLRTLDALTGASALIGKLQAHATMVSHHSRALEDADARREAELVLSLGAQLNAHDRQEFVGAMAGAHSELVRQAADSGASAALAALKRARTDIGAIGMMGQVITRWDSVYSLLEKPAPALTWDRAVSAPAPSKLPPAGKPALVLFGSGRSTMPALRRLERQFGERVQLVLANRTYGWFRGEGPFAPAIELDSLTTYLRDELEAPGAVILSAPGSGRRPDGRIAREFTANEKAYQAGFGTFLVVIDAAGTIRHVSDRFDEARLVAKLEQVTR